MSGTERGLHIDKTLVAGAAEHEVQILLGLDKRTIDQHLQIRQHLTHDRVGRDLLESETGIAPDGAMQLLDDAFGKNRKSLGLIHRVAPREGDVALRLRQAVEDFIDRHRLARREGPCLGIMASGTGMSASGTIDTGAPTGTIDGGHINNGNGTFTTMQACSLDLYDQDFTSYDDDKFHCDVVDFDGDGKNNCS